VQFYTKCAVLVLFCAVLTAHLSGGANSGPQASWLDSGEENGKREAKKSGRKKRRKGKGKKVEGDKGEKRGKKENEGGKGGILCSCDFSLGETLGQLIYKISRSRNISGV